MITDTEFDAIADELHLNDSTRQFIQTIRHGQPVRRVNRRINITLRFPSVKMGRTIQGESRSGEGLACLFYESDAQVLEFYDQPHTFRVPYQGGFVEHTPDFLVIRRTISPEGIVSHSITFEEWRTSDRMDNYAKDDPKRWVPLLDGNWTQLPIEEFLRAQKLDYRIRLIDTTPQILARNYELLQDHFLTPLDLAPALVEAARRAAGAELGITLEKALGAVEGLDVDAAQAMVAQGKLFANLREALLTTHAAVRLYVNRDLLELTSTPKPVERGEVSCEPGALVRLGDEQFEVLSVSEQKVYLTSTTSGRGRELALHDFTRWAESGELVGISDGRTDIARELNDRDPALVVLANARLKQIEPFLRSQTRPESRSLRRWIRSYKHAEELHGDGFLGLLSDVQERGRRGPRLSDETEEIAARVIREQLLRPDRLAVRKAYGIFQEECALAKVEDMAMSCFHYRWTLIRHADRLRARVGAKAANAAAMRGGSGSGLVLPANGDRALARGDIDHTTLDLMLVDSATGEPIGKPECTLVVDAHTRYILVALVLFQKPSAETDMLALRELVRAHHQLPSTIVVDGGSDFSSGYFESLVAALKSKVQHRRTGFARDGSPVESAFKALDTDLIWTLRGNTQNLKNPRALDPAFAPSKRAIWTLGALQEELDRYVAWKNAQPVRSLGGSPADLFARSMAAAGPRTFRRIAYTTAFRALTAHTGANGSRATVTRDGVRINNLQYRAAAFLLPGVEGTKVPVRYEPLDARVAYARVHKVWHVCHAEYAELAGCTEKLIGAASQELRRRLGKEPSMHEIATYLTAVQAREVELDRDQKLRLLRAEEQKKLVARRDTLDEEPAAIAATEPAEPATPAASEPAESRAIVLEGYEQATPEELRALLGDDDEEQAA